MVFLFCLKSNTFGDSVWEMYSPLFVHSLKGKIWVTLLVKENYSLGKMSLKQTILPPERNMTACVSTYGVIMIIQKQMDEKEQEKNLKTFWNAWLILILIQCNDFRQMINLYKIPSSAFCLFISSCYGYFSIVQWIVLYISPAFIVIKSLTLILMYNFGSKGLMFSLSWFSFVS